MSTTFALPADDQLVIVNDGAYRWVGERAEILDWLRDHGKVLYRSAVELTADEYEHLCDDTRCYVSSDACGGDDIATLDRLDEAGVETIFIE